MLLKYVYKKVVADLNFLQQNSEQIKKDIAFISISQNK